MIALIHRAMRTRLALTLIAAALAVSTPSRPASGQCAEGWAQTTPGGESPSPRLLHAAAYHAATGRTVVFGGTDGSSGSHDLGDTWTWDGENWTEELVTGPQSRYSAVMAPHEGTGELVLFSGFDGPTETYLGDTWLWNGSVWSRWSSPVPGAPTPAARSYHAMAYHPPTDTVVLYGGSSDAGGPWWDTWIWDGVSWSEVALGEPNPGPRSDHAMAYDPVSGMVLLWGGRLESGPLPVDTWGWDGAQWQQLGVVGPPGRLLPAMSTDPTCERVLMFGGEIREHTASGGTLDNDTWEWDGAALTWTERVDLAGSAPTPRDRLALVTDTARGVLVLFGGREPVYSPLSETYEFCESPCDDPSLLDADPSAEPLRVRRQASNQVALSWRDLGADTVYEWNLGTLDALWTFNSYDHSLTQLTIAPGSVEALPSADSYFLVRTSCNCLPTSLGRDSFGVERP